MDLNYIASPTARKFHADESFVRSMMGPVGSGKSVAMCVEVFLKCCSQTAWGGVRRSRWVFIRNTYSELRDTTCKTWFDWFPKNMGKFHKQEMIFVMRFMLPDGTIVESEILFRPLDKTQDLKKLLSLELTGAFLNEAREIPKIVFEMTSGRVGRYPSKKNGGCSWHGIILDSNPMSDDHWFAENFIHNLPANSAFFRQPSGLCEDAENIENLPKNYYTNLAIGKTPEWVDVYIKGNLGVLNDNRPVYPEFFRTLHVLENNEKYNNRYEILIGCDFGRTPAAVFAQKIDDRFIVLSEICLKNSDASTFAHEIKQHISRFYAHCSVIATGDPAGNFGGQESDDSCIKILNHVGIPIDPCYTNSTQLRNDSVSFLLKKLNGYGEPRLAINPNCKMLIKGCAGDFYYRKIAAGGDERFSIKREKTKTSHVCESLEYMLLGNGVGDEMMSDKNFASNLSVIMSDGTRKYIK